MATVVVASTACASTAFAQHAQENAMAEASDAFGITVGREKIGLYSANDARGFSPTEAGNLRISGLYFDQITYAMPGSRITTGSTVHVGISAQGFLFPAPTGVVNYDLRTPGTEPETSVLVGIASYDQAFGEVDLQAPLIKDVLSIGGGIGYARNSAYRFSPSTKDWNIGAILSWRPIDGLTLVPFWSKQWHTEDGERPIVFIGDSGWPKFRSVDLMPQRWAEYDYETSTSGATLSYAFGEGWQINAGLFHSERTLPRNYEATLTDVQGDGGGQYSVAASSPRTNRSRSGEFRLTKSMSSQDISHAIHLSLKGRNRRNEFGGFDSRFVGPATTTWVPQIPMPAFNPGPTTRMQENQFTPGLAYQGRVRDVGQLSLGVQRSYYERTITSPDSAPTTDKEEPWLYDLAAAFHVNSRLTMYASYTRGFEEVGIAPPNAVNRDEAVPAQITEQIDAGVRYRWTPKLTMVAGVFEIQKPYFDLDDSAVYRQVGTTSNRGLEFSLTGELIPELSVVAGLTLIDPTVRYETPDGIVESEAVGPVAGLMRANFQYSLVAVPGLMIEAEFERMSKRYAVYDAIELPGVTTIGAGIRYETLMWGNPATLRLQLDNLTNEYGVTPAASGEIIALDSRRFELSLAVDL